ncbi:hypothetical protein D3C78_1003500 [compost metagenome]
MEGRTEGVIICRSRWGYIPVILQCASLYRIAILPRKQSGLPRPSWLPTFNHRSSRRILGRHRESKKRPDCDPPCKPPALKLKNINDLRYIGHPDRKAPHCRRPCRRGAGAAGRADRSVTDETRLHRKAGFHRRHFLYVGGWRTRPYGRSGAA